MRTVFVECPSCGTPLHVQPSLAGSVCRCGACAREFSVPSEFCTSPGLLPVAPWRRVRTGLAVTYYAGLIVLITVLLGAGLLAAFSLMAPPEVWEELSVSDETPAEASLLLLSSMALSGLAFIAFLVTCGGCLTCLAVPPASLARGWLVASVATLLVGILAVGALFLMVVIAVVELDLEGDNSDGVMQLLFSFLVLSMVLHLLTVVCHAGFLRKLATYLGNDGTARSAAGFQLLLLLASPVFALGLCLLPFAAVDGSPTSTVIGLAALLVLTLLLGWWLALVNAVRRSVRLGLRPLR